MNISPFLKILRDLNVDSNAIEKIRKDSKSPFKYAVPILKTVPEDNNIEHSYRVFQGCKEMISKSRVSILTEDYLLLFYASLLHDVAKSENAVIKPALREILKKECKLFSHDNSDHGTRAAHYIDREYKKKKLELYGLNNSITRQLLNIISFHAVGEMHPCFVNFNRMTDKELFLCLTFWLSDITDGAMYRVEAAQTVDKGMQSAKTRARRMVKEVWIENNCIIWHVDKSSVDTTRASEIETKKLSRHRLLLQAFGLPNRIICLKPRKRLPGKESFLDCTDITSANICTDASKRSNPLVLSADTLPELYENVVRAFYNISAKDSVSYSNYFGPVVLEVKNVENDEADKTNIRSETGKNFDIVKEYTQIWLNPSEGGEKEFYFGYTHGQRIWGYKYPRYPADCTPEFQNWHGKIDQFDHVTKILRAEKLNARRCYVLIPHPIIDNPKSKFYHKEEVAPALIAVQFALEKDNRLSAFALLRSQELSLFFVVNYLEVKQLIEKLIEKLKNDINGVKPGRIVMMTALAYFAPNTVLLDKPKMCKKTAPDIESYGSDFNSPTTRREFINLLEDFKKDYIKIESYWCGLFANALPAGKKFTPIKEATFKLKTTLNSLEKKRGNQGYSTTHPDIRETKIMAVDDFIKIIKEYS